MSQSSQNNTLCLDVFVCRNCCSYCCSIWASSNFLKRFYCLLGLQSFMERISTTSSQTWPYILIFWSTWSIRFDLIMFSVIAFLSCYCFIYCIYSLLNSHKKLFHFFLRSFCCKPVFFFFRCCSLLPCSKDLMHLPLLAGPNSKLAFTSWMNFNFTASGHWHWLILYAL